MFIWYIVYGLQYREVKKFFINDFCKNYNIISWKKFVDNVLYIVKNIYINMFKNICLVVLL